MTDTITVSGIVLSASPMGENDRRVVLLTRELGKISAFARNARRQGNSLSAAANAFAFGEFTLIQGRTSYTMSQASIRNYFRELTMEIPDVYYGYYFLEFVDYYGREGIDGTDMLNLLYISLRALLKKEIDNRLVRRIFELRLMTINGEYAVDVQNMSPSAEYACRYIMGAPLEKLYSFTVTEEVLKELEHLVDRHKSRIVDRPLQSLPILEQMTD